VFLSKPKRVSTGKYILLVLFLKASYKLETNRRMTNNLELSHVEFKTTVTRERAIKALSRYADENGITTVRDLHAKLEMGKSNFFKCICPATKRDGQKTEIRYFSNLHLLKISIMTNTSLDYLFGLTDEPTAKEKPITIDQVLDLLAILGEHGLITINQDPEILVTTVEVALNAKSTQSNKKTPLLRKVS